MNVKNIYELSPIDGRKSFYGKAHVLILDNGAEALMSYETIVAVKTPDGVIHRTWDDWSATTGRHLSAFGVCGKAAWDKMPVENADTFTEAIAV